MCSWSEQKVANIVAAEVWHRKLVGLVKIKIKQLPVQYNFRHDTDGTENWQHWWKSRSSYLFNEISRHDTNVNLTQLHEPFNFQVKYDMPCEMKCEGGQNSLPFIIITNSL